MTDISFVSQLFEFESLDIFLLVSSTLQQKENDKHY